MNVSILSVAKTQTTHGAENGCGFVAVETIWNGSHMMHIRHLSAHTLGQSKSNEWFGHTTYCEKVPSTLKPLSFASGQSAVKNVGHLGVSGPVRNAYFVLCPCDIVHS
jgi:hypothetical protein